MFFAGKPFTWCCDAMKATKIRWNIFHFPSHFHLEFIALTIRLVHWSCLIYLSLLCAVLFKRAVILLATSDEARRCSRSHWRRTPSARQFLPSAGYVSVSLRQILPSTRWIDLEPIFWWLLSFICLFFCHHDCQACLLYCVKQLFTPRNVWVERGDGLLFICVSFQICPVLVECEMQMH